MYWPLLLLLLASMVPSVDAQAPEAQPGRLTWESTGEDAGALRYRLYRPASGGAGPLPLFLMLHGCTQDPDDFARGTRMNRMAEEHGFLVAYPEQPSTAHPQRCWSWYDAAHQARGTGEPARLAAVVDHVRGIHSVDPARVYVTGISAGGAMALILASTYPDLFAAAAVHSAVAPGEASSLPEALAAMDGRARDRPEMAGFILERMGARRRSFPVMVLHGMSDDVVAVANADRIARQWAGVSAGVGRPLGEHPAELAGAARITRWTDGANGVRMELWKIEDVGHAWSGGSVEGSYTAPAGPDATFGVVRFLLSHSNP